MFIVFRKILLFESILKFIPELIKNIVEFVMFVPVVEIFILFDPAIFNKIEFVFSIFVSFWEIKIFSKEFT